MTFFSFFFFIRTRTPRVVAVIYTCNILSSCLILENVTTFTHVLRTFLVADLHFEGLALAFLQLPRPNPRKSPSAAESQDPPLGFCEFQIVLLLKVTLKKSWRGDREESATAACDRKTLNLEESEMRRQQNIY